MRQRWLQQKLQSQIAISAVHVHHVARHNLLPPQLLQQLRQQLQQLKHQLQPIQLL
jgi:hypothetical protein